MRLLVVGASGPTGRALIDAACAQGHEVRAFSPVRIEDLRVDVEAVTGDVLDEGAVFRAVSGCDAVLCALGPQRDSPRDLCSRGTANLIAAMHAARVRRLVCITGAMVGLPDDELGWLYRRLRSARGIAAQLGDRREQERLVRASGLQWTLVRPPRLTNAPPRRPARACEHLHVGALARVSRRALADFMLAATASTHFAGRALTVLG